MKHIKDIENVSKILLSPKLYETIVYDYDDKDDIVKIVNLKSFDKKPSGLLPFLPRNKPVRQQRRQKQKFLRVCYLGMVY